MSRVKAVDAVMIYTPDPARLADWYAQHLGIATRLEQDGNRYGDIADGAERVTHFGVYPQGSSGRRGVMVNYRVEDFEGCLERLHTLGTPILETIEEPFGRFAYVHDCDGNVVEIWSPKERPAGT